MEIWSQPWPWYVVGPLIGLLVPLMLLLDNKRFGISTTFQHICAAVAPGKASYFLYDWRRTGGWQLALAVGTIIGGFIAGVLLANPEPVAISEATQADLAGLGLSPSPGMVPPEIFTWAGLGTLAGLVIMVGGGFLIGFGARYAGGCTSGHGITGLAGFELGSLLAVVGFFIGGLASTHFLLPLLLGGGS